MDEHLQDLIRKRRSEKCPPSVIAEVQREIKIATASRNTRPRILWALGTASILIVISLSVLLLRSRPQELQPAAETATLSELDHQRIIEEARISLASIGHLLIAAGHSSETIISEQILPPLRGGLQTIQNKLENQP